MIIYEHHTLADSYPILNNNTLWYGMAGGISCEPVSSSEQVLCHGVMNFIDKLTGHSWGEVWKNLFQFVNHPVATWPCNATEEIEVTLYLIKINLNMTQIKNFDFLNPEKWKYFCQTTTRTPHQNLTKGGVLEV